MFLKLEKVGCDSILKATVWRLTYRCDDCGRINSFGFSSCEDDEIVQRVMKEAHYSGKCRQCTEWQYMKRKGLPQQLTLW